MSTIGNKKKMASLFNDSEDEKEVHEIKKVNESILFGDKEGG